MANKSGNNRFEEEDDTWIPLVPAERETPVHDDQFDPVSQRGRSTSDRTTNTTNSNNDNNSSSSSSSNNSNTTSSSRNRNRNNNTTNTNDDHLQSIQRRLETRVAVQTNLVNHPVDLFWRRFLLNFIQEIWSLEVRIRLGLFLLLAGFGIRCFLYSIWYILYPRVAILSMIIVGSIIYLDPLDVQLQLKGIGTIIGSPNKALQVLEQLDLSQLRIVSFCLFLIPTILEVRTLSFLSQIKAESGWTMYNIGIGAILLTAMLSLYNLRAMNPRECSYQGMLILYGSALVITIMSWDIRRIPVLAGPFLSATGTLLLTYHDDDMEWISRIVRHTVRLTLRDVLSSVGGRVAEDEMLQLAILRWICDFWANNQEPTVGPSASSSSPSTAAETAAAQPMASGNTTRPQGEAPSSTSSSSAPPPSSQSTPHPSEGAPDTRVSPKELEPPAVSSQEEYHLRDIQWQELLPMLNIEINHMEAEVEALQSENRPSTGNRNDDFHTSTNRPQTGQSGCRTTRPTQNQPDIQSFEGLKSMLLDLNIDDRAKPAVLAYRRAIESFPPDRRRAVAMSVIRRCPASLTIVLQIFFGSPRTLFTSVVILFPFIVMEYLRIIHWIESCQRVATVCGFTQAEQVGQENIQNSWGVPQGLQNVDTMAILLCGDTSMLRPPTLLLVWQNIVSSVDALEVGLTAARCAETSVVAVDFAGNVMDLVQFGLEVSQRGLLHGLMVMAKEAISIHATGVDLNDLHHNVDDESAVRYTRAAVRAVHSGQRVARNIHLLSEDEHVGAIVQPILMTLEFLTGHGWLWGRDVGRDDPTTSPENNNSTDESHGERIDPYKKSTPNSEPEAQATQYDGVTTTTTEGSPILSGPSVGPTVIPETPETIAKEEDCDDSIPPLSSPQDELSEVMEMVSSAYEQCLIDMEEKNEFYEKLSRLQQSDLLDVSVVAGIKRTLLIILENGCMVSMHDDTCASATIEDAGVCEISCFELEQRIHIEDNVVARNNVVSEPSLPDDTDSERHTEGAAASFGHDSDFIPLDTTSENDVNTHSQESSTDDTGSDDRNGALVKLGVAALGVVAGGLLLSMRGRNENNDNSNSTNRTTTDDEYERNESSTVEIEELPDDDRDDDWVSVAQ